MTGIDFARMLNGRKYGNEITREEEKEAADLGLVVVFGYSDDGVEFKGCISEEEGAYQGRKFYITPKLKIKQKPKEGRKLIEAKWDPKELECSWLIDSEIPHANFDILEQGELFCRGIVFHVSDVVGYRTIEDSVQNHE